MRAGNLRHLVSLQSATAVEDDYGEDVETFAEYAPVYADITPLSGKEFFDAQQVNSEISIKVIIRYRSDVKASHRVVFNDQILEIVAPPINPRFRNRELQLLCKVVS